MGYCQKHNRTWRDDKTRDEAFVCPDCERWRDDEDDEEGEEERRPRAMIWTLELIEDSCLVIVRDEQGIARDSLDLNAFQNELYGPHDSPLVAKLRGGESVRVLVCPLVEVKVV